jgi:hypothetical protein
MSLAREVKSDIKAAKKIRLPRWALLCLLVFSMPLPWLFDHFGKLYLFLPIFNCIAVLAFMLVFKRRLWRHAWFWVTMTVIAALHVPLILFVPWGTRWVPAMAIAAIDSLDFCLILWILAIVEKFMREQKTAERRDRSL